MPRTKQQTPTVAPMEPLYVDASPKAPEPETLSSVIQNVKSHLANEVRDKANALSAEARQIHQKATAECQKTAALLESHADLIQQATRLDWQEAAQAVRWYLGKPLEAARIVPALLKEVDAIRGIVRMTELLYGEGTREYIGLARIEALLAESGEFVARSAVRDIERLLRPVANSLTQNAQQCLQRLDEAMTKARQTLAILDKTVRGPMPEPATVYLERVETAGYTDFDPRERNI